MTGSAPEGENNHNHIDGQTIEVLETQSGLSASGRQLRGSFQTLRVEQCEINADVTYVYAV